MNELDFMSIIADVQHRRLSATTVADDQRNTVLGLAALQNNIELVELLLDHYTGDIYRALHKANADMDTPLHLVCREDNVRMAQILIDRGASVGITNHANQRPLDLCTSEAKSILLTGHEYSLEMLCAHQYALWFEMITMNDVYAETQGLAEKVLNYVSRDSMLAIAQDCRGRMAYEVVTGTNRTSLLAQLVLHARYRILDGRPFHASMRSVVFRCEDLETLDGNCKPILVAVKLLRRKAVFKRELVSRDAAFSDRCVMKILLSYPGYDRLPAVQLSNDVDDGGMEEGEVVPYDPLSPHALHNQNSFSSSRSENSNNNHNNNNNDNDKEDQLSTKGANQGQAWGEVGVAAMEPTPTSMDHPEFDPLATWPDDILLDPPDRVDKTTAERMFTLVLPWADCTLATALRQGGFAGSLNLSETILIFSQICQAVMEIHQKGLIHGDLKPSHMVRHQGVWKVIDLGGACVIGTEYGGWQISTAYAPPEALCVQGDGELAQVSVRTSTNLHQSNRLQRVGSANGNRQANHSHHSLKRSFLTIPGLLAHPSFDVWSLGCVLYQMCSQGTRPLFYADNQDNLVTDRQEDDNLYALYAWKDELKARKLARISSSPLVSTTTSTSVLSSKVPTPATSSSLPPPPAASDNPNNHPQNEYTFPYQPLDPHPFGLARNLIAQMLHKDPSRRPTIHRVLAHPFMTHLTKNHRSSNRIPAVTSHAMTTPAMTAHAVMTQAITTNITATNAVTTNAITTNPMNIPLSTHPMSTHPMSSHDATKQSGTLPSVNIPRMVGQQPTFDIYISYRGIEEKHRRVGDDSFLAEQLAMIWREQGFSVYLEGEKGLETEGGLERQEGLQRENGGEGGLGEEGVREGVNQEDVLDVYDVSRGDVYDANGVSQVDMYLPQEGGVYRASLLEGSQGSLNSPGSLKASAGEGEEGRRGFGSINVGNSQQGSQQGSPGSSQQGGHLLGVRLEGFSQGSWEGARLDGFTWSNSHGGTPGAHRGVYNPGVISTPGDTVSLHSGDAVEVALYPGSGFKSAFNSGAITPAGGSGGVSRGGSGGKRPKHPPKTIGPLVLAQGQGLELETVSEQRLALASADEPGLEPAPGQGLTSPPKLTRHEALARSRVCVCLISRQAINSDGGAAASTTAPVGPYAPSYSLFSTDSPCDELLLEHRLALELHACGMIEAIVPVLVGDFNIVAQKYGNYYIDDCHPRAVPALVVTSVEKALVSVLTKLALGPVPLVTNRTVASVLSGLVGSYDGGVFLEGTLPSITKPVSSSSPTPHHEKSSPAVSPHKILSPPGLALAPVVNAVVKALAAPGQGLASGQEVMVSGGVQPPITPTPILLTSQADIFRSIVATREKTIEEIREKLAGLKFREQCLVKEKRIIKSRENDGLLREKKLEAELRLAKDGALRLQKIINAGVHEHQKHPSHHSGKPGSGANSPAQSMREGGSGSMQSLREASIQSLREDSGSMQSMREMGGSMQSLRESPSQSVRGGSPTLFEAEMMALRGMTQGPGLAFDSKKSVTDSKKSVNDSKKSVSHYLPTNIGANPEDSARLSTAERKNNNNNNGFTNNSP